MTLRRLLKQKPALLAGALLMVAGAATLYFPETWYPEETQWQLATEKDIPGIQGGLSGLTWNPDSGTLFAVTDHPSSVVELDTDGNVLRVIPSDGDHDFEAIEYLGRNRYVLSRERERILTTHHIDRNTSILPPASYILTLDVDRKSDNAGFEGLARGRGENALIVAQEKKPLRFLETDHSHDSLSVSDSLTHRLSLPWFLKDISGLHYDRKNRRLYVLSHESALVMVSDPEGRLEGDAAAPGTQWSGAGHSTGGGDSF
ncbi:YjiK family protein [Salmonella enterica]|nr:YjiK family protein [Salmonella enterica subsp. enterica serovar Mbandaka]EKJ9040548.1 YjiK family protein [Salmonella enterica]EIW9794129.1 YjiK family protein [Salmonella enterica subsp. enterica serovar Mbandaka]EKK1140350.1 YjiK family protein [Salmonella enterica]EKK1433489.1 YjiK family protein [Salmonella enterica]